MGADYSSYFKLRNRTYEYAGLKKSFQKVVTPSADGSKRQRLQERTPEDEIDEEVALDAQLVILP